MNETLEKESNTNDERRALLRAAFAKDDINVVYKMVTQRFAHDLTFLMQPYFNKMPFLFYLIQSGEVEHVEAFFNYCDAQHIIVDRLLHKSFRGVPPLLIAIRQHKLEIVKFFLTRDSQLVSQYDDTQAAALHYVVRHFLRSKDDDEREYVEEFIQLPEADLGAADKGGNTCLHEAAKNGGHHLIDYLLKEDSSFEIDAKNNEGDT